MFGPASETVLVIASLLAGCIAVVVLRIFWVSVRGLVRDELDAVRADRASAVPQSEATKPALRILPDPRRRAG